MQTVRALCYMKASQILSMETCQGVPGDLYAASIFLLIAATTDFISHMKSQFR